MPVSAGTAIGVKVAILCLITVVVLPVTILLRVDTLLQSSLDIQRDDQKLAVTVAATQVEEQLQFLADQVEATSSAIEYLLSIVPPSPPPATPPSYIDALDLLSQSESMVFQQLLGVSVLYTEGVDGLGLYAFSPDATSPTTVGFISAAQQPTTTFPPGDDVSATTTSPLLKVNNTAAGSLTQSQIWITNSSNPLAVAVGQGVSSPTSRPFLVSSDSCAQQAAENATEVSSIDGTSSLLFSAITVQTGKTLQDTWRSVEYCQGVKKFPTTISSLSSIHTAVTGQLRADTIALGNTMAGAMYDDTIAWFAVVELSTQMVVSFWDSSVDATTASCLAAATTSAAAKACVPTAMDEIPVLGTYIIPRISQIIAQNTDSGDLYRYVVGGDDDSAGADSSRLTIIAKHIRVFTTSTSLSPTQYTFIAADATMVKRDLTAATAPIYVYCVLILAGALLIGWWTKRYFLDDLRLLQTAMQGVMKLDFEATEEQRKRKGFFTEINSLRAGFIRTAETIQMIMRYIPKEVVKDMISAGNLNSREMISKKITVIFLDIFDFSKLCESLNSDDLVQLAERYFGLATKTLTQHGCTIDKFIGDVVMGFWGAPLEYVRQGYSALCAALHLLSTSKRLVTAFDKFNHTLVLRIGITSGQCAVGNIGSDERVSYTALGDTVNLASRLQLLNSFYKCQLICAESVLIDANGTTATLTADDAAQLESEGIEVECCSSHGEDKNTADKKNQSVRLISTECPEIFASRRLGLVRVKGKAAPTAVFHVCGVHKEILSRIHRLSDHEGQAKAEEESTRASSSSVNVRRGGLTAAAAAATPSGNYRKTSILSRGSSFVGTNNNNNNNLNNSTLVRKFQGEYSTKSRGGAGGDLSESDRSKTNTQFRSHDGGSVSNDQSSSVGRDNVQEASGSNQEASGGGREGKRGGDVLLEKATMLTLAQEVNILRRLGGGTGGASSSSYNSTFAIEEGDGTKIVTSEQLFVLHQLTKAMDHFEDMRFEDAVACYQKLLQERSVVLTSLGLDIPTLTNQCDYWQLLVAHTPPRDSFDPCENMTTK